MGSISTRMTERFGCRHPFAAAGMAFAGGTADLALGVCAGGGSGAVGVGFTPGEQIRAIVKNGWVTLEHDLAAHVAALQLFLCLAANYIHHVLLAVTTAASPACDQIDRRHWSDASEIMWMKC